MKSSGFYGDMLSARKRGLICVAYVIELQIVIYCSVVRFNKKDYQNALPKRR